MAEYSRMASGTVTSTGGQTAVMLPFIPNYIEITNPARIAAAGGGVGRAWWMTDLGQGAALYTTTSAGPADGSVYISSSTGGGFTTIQAGLALQYGATQTIGASGSIAKTSHTAITVTTTAAHGLVTGNWVVFQNLYATSSTGMQQIAGIPFMVTVTNSTVFTVYWDGNQSNYTAITGSGSALQAAASFKKILYPVLYAPGLSIVAAVSTSGATTTVTTTAPHNFKVGQEIAFRIPPIYGPYELNAYPNTSIPGSPVYYYVSTVPTSTTFTIQNAPSYTAFTTANVAFDSYPGIDFPQVVAIGDVNSGGTAYSGASLYPSPSVFNGFTSSTTAGVSTINGPAISGAYINATFQGFVIGATISGTAADVLYWRAYMHDINS